MSLIAKTAEAVKEELAQGRFSLPFKAIRAFRHDQTLPEGKELRVAVVPKGMTVTPAARAVCRHDIEIFVAVTKKIDRAQPEVIDPLVGLVEEIVAFFRLRRLRLFPEAAWVATETKPVISTEHLEKLKQATGLVTLTYRVNF